MTTQASRTHPPHLCAVTPNNQIRYVRYQTEDRHHINQNEHGCSVPRLYTNTRSTLPRTAWPFRVFFAPDQAQIR